MKKKKTETKKADLFFITITTAGKIYKVDGETISGALNKIKIDTFKMKGILTVEHKGVVKSVVLTIPLLRKMVQPINKIFFEKRLQILLR